MDEKNKQLEDFGDCYKTAVEQVGNNTDKSCESKVAG